MKRIVLASYTLSMIIFSSIVIGFSKDIAIIYCSATLASICTFFFKNYAKISRIAKNELFMSFSPQQR